MSMLQKIPTTAKTAIQKHRIKYVTAPETERLLFFYTAKAVPMQSAPVRLYIIANCLYNILDIDILACKTYISALLCLIAFCVSK